MVPIAHEQNVICTKTRLDITTHEQTIICRQLFAGHVVGSRLMERKEKMHRMIMFFIQLVCKFTFDFELLVFSSMSDYQSRKTERTPTL